MYYISEHPCSALGCDNMSLVSRLALVTGKSQHAHTCTAKLDISPSTYVHSLSKLYMQCVKLGQRAVSRVATGWQYDSYSRIQREE